MKNMKSISYSYKKGNEDCYYIDETMGFVIDGASGLDGVKITSSYSDAYWYSHRLKDNLIKYKNKETLRAMVQCALHDTNQEFDGYLGDQVLRDYPSAVIAMVRVKDDYELEYFILGDCECIIEKKDSHIIQLADHRIEYFDQKAIDYGKRIQKEKNINFIDTKKYFQFLLQKHRTYKNIENGYFCLSNNENILDEAVIGTIDCDDVKSVALMSDGFSQLIHLFKLYSLETFMSQLQVCTAQDLLNELHYAQSNDADMNNFPRMSFSDDATLVYFEMSSSDHHQ